MSRKAVHHHYASASKNDPDNVTALHSSSGSNASTESSEDEMDIKWSDRGYTMSEIVDQFSLPLIVRCSTNGRTPRTSLPIPFNISQEHLLLFSVREVRHLIATNINDTTGHNVAAETLHNDVTIPEDFDGLFVRPYITKNESELKIHQSIDSLIKSGTKGFFTLTSIRGILQRASQSGSKYYNSHVKTSYPSGSLFLIEDIQNWSEKFKPIHYTHYALPSTRSRSSSAARKPIVSQTSRMSTINSDLEDDQSSYVIASGAPTSTIPTHLSVPLRKSVSVKENEDVVWIKMAEDDDVFLLDKPPQLGVLHHRPRSRSSSSDSNYNSMNSTFVKCKDSFGKYVYFSLSTTGQFIQVHTHPKNPQKLSQTIHELINSDTLPSIIRFVYGKKIRLLMASGFLKPKRTETHHSVLACSLGKSSFVFFEVPMTSPMKFCLSLNKGMLSTSRIRSALRLCENKGNEFVTDMKVIINLSSGPPKKEGRISASESSSKLEDIAEEIPEAEEVESNNSDKEISQLTKDCAKLSLEGIIYI